MPDHRVPVMAQEVVELLRSVAVRQFRVGLREQSPRLVGGCPLVVCLHHQNLSE